jgi:DNA-3-methyladenine glycosylase
MIEKEFFNRDTLIVSQELLGKIIVRNIEGITYRAKIVETEAYLGINDRAAHTFAGRKTERNKIMYEDAGTIYVYQSYGIHYLMNFVTLDKNTPEATLIRAVDPINQLDNVSLNRFGKLYSELTNYQKKNLTNGPGKLTKALKINKNLNGANLFSSEIYLEEGDSDFDIVVDKRIGIDYSKEAIDYPYRFYIKDNDNVSILKK